jgi:hypothetical protein
VYPFSKVHLIKITYDGCSGNGHQISGFAYNAFISRAVALFPVFIPFHVIVSITPAINALAESNEPKGKTRHINNHKPLAEVSTGGQSTPQSPFAVQAPYLFLPSPIYCLPSTSNRL